jgi:hypothetical protein
MVRINKWDKIINTVKPRFTYSSIYILSTIYVLFLFNVLLYIRTQIRFTYFILHTQIRYTYFVLRTRIQYTNFKYLKQSTDIEFEYVKQSTYIKFEYVLRIIVSFQFCKFFDFLFWVRHADAEWQLTCTNSIERKETDDFNFTLQ